MKKVKINAYQVGLLFKEGVFNQLLTEGTYWIWYNEKLEVYEKGSNFVPTIALNILLQNQEVAEALEVVEVGDNEIVLQFEEKRFRTILTTGRYAFWKGVKHYTYQRANLSDYNIGQEFDKQLLNTKLAAYVRTYNVESYEKGLMIVNGKLEGVLDGGVYQWWKNSTLIQVAKVDMRQLQLEISGQEILTKDKANLRLNFYVQYRIVDVVKAAFDNKDLDRQLYMLMQLALREYVGGLTLDELLEKKDSLSQYVLESTATRVADLGVQIKTSGVRDIILPGDMKDIMNQVLMAEKKAQANVIMRREETASMRSLLNTAKLMEENATLWKLKEMEYVEKIAEKINTISVSGNGQILDQLKQIFVNTK
jgi:regulator of protease activity HflC (stomatin/prohibitin superfamily)